MKKIIWIIIFIAVGWAGFSLLNGKEDTWIKGTDGRWVRQGNPPLPIPQNVLVDCYEQNSNRAFDFAVIACREDLCDADEACARLLEREFEKLNETKSPASTLTSIRQSEEQDEQNYESTKMQTDDQQSNNEVKEPLNNNAQPADTISDVNSPTATSTETVEPTNSNTNIPSQKPTPEPTPYAQPTEQTVNISIDSPVARSTVTSPFVITGKVKADVGDSITMQIKNTTGTVLISETARLKNVDAKTGWGTFKITISYEFSSTREGYLVVSSSSRPHESLAIQLNFQ